MARRHRRDFGADRRRAFSGWDRITTASWFWARGVAMVFTMRSRRLILTEAIANGSRATRWLV